MISSTPRGRYGKNASALIKLKLILLYFSVVAISKKQVQSLYFSKRPDVPKLKFLDYLKF